MAERVILAVVPARGGSKGIPLKNLKKVRGLSLIEHVALVIKQVPAITHAVVSTDSDEIAEEARRVGLSVPFMRPTELAGDRVGDLPVLQHAVSSFEKMIGAQVDRILMLQPTCPFRRPSHIEWCLTALSVPSIECVWTVTRVDVKFHPLKQLKFQDGKLELLDSRGSAIVARQQLEPTFIRNGACYAWKRKALIERSEFLPKASTAVEITDRLINIDTEEDLARAQELDE
jgi:CMP-N,N'-diacetyllegionaminic acid synthase